MMSTRRFRPEGAHQDAASVVLADKLASVGGNLGECIPLEFKGSGESVKVSSIGDPSACGTTRRVSIRRPFASTRTTNGVRPNL